jgi:hypothetical protein
MPIDPVGPCGPNTCAHLVPFQYQKPTLPPVIAGLVLYTNNEIAGDVMVVISVVDCRLIRGTNIPLLVLLTSRIAEASGAAPVLFIETF